MGAGFGGALSTAALTDAEREQITAVARTGEHVGQDETRFFGQPSELKTGKPGEATQGLEGLMCVDRKRFFRRVSEGIAGIEEEAEDFADLAKDGKLENVSPEEGQEVLDIVDYICRKKAGEIKKQYPNGVLDQGRPPVRLNHFTSHDNAIQAKLLEEEVAALRIYTTLVYKYMNQPLRDTLRYEKGRACPLPVTTYHAEKGIKKLRGLRSTTSEQQQAQDVVLWRGLRSTHVTADFTKHGGTELAFMSTTKNLDVAVRYSLSAHSLLFKIVVPNFIALGAELQWLSAFPGEEEILYPPLTYLAPTNQIDEVRVDCGDGRRVCFTVIELRPTMA